MTKKDLFLAGFLLFTVPAFAQNVNPSPNLDDPRSAKVVFSQDFEQWWDFTQEPVDKIEGVQYWTKTGSSSFSGKVIYTASDWMKANPPVTKGLVRDTTILLFNEVRITDSNDLYKWYTDDYEFMTDDSPSRHDEFESYGEDGGRYLFKYVSDIPEGNNANGYTYSSNGGYGANYRRNLFIRGLDIEDESSYRLTFYVKVNPVQDYKGQQRLYADVMRGCNLLDKPFSMGLENKASEYKYNRTFSLEKTSFTGDWEKVTMMTYYLNDSIADGFVFVDGYWWSDEWTWPGDTTFVTNPYGDPDIYVNHPELHYPVQPDKYFIRLSFASDSTEFLVDNISVTKSWIAGCEYYKDRMRVDFGYETNLRRLTKLAQKENRIAEVEVPSKYLTIYGLKKGGNRDNPDDWSIIDIASAEYHDDGYMYIFTDWVDKNDHSQGRQLFSNYDEVLVNFTNPDEEELKLYYTGITFPKSLDIDWIKAGKPVPDFYNEMATPNEIIFQDVYSMYERGPLLKAFLTVPDNSFGLDGNIREFKFQFTKEMAIDNPANAEARTRCIVYVGDEIWDRAWDDANNTLIITRPSKYTTPMYGDYEIQINALYDKNNSDYKSPNVTIHYNFGAIDRDIQATEVEWKTNFSDPRNSVNKCSPVNCAFSRYQNFWWGGGSNGINFKIGDGKSDSNYRIYWHDSAEKYKRTYLLSSRGSANGPGAIYFGYVDTIMLHAGINYSISYAAYQLNRSMPIKIYVYPWTADPQYLSEDDKDLVATINPLTFWPERDENGNSIRDYDDNDTLLVPTNIGFTSFMGGRSIIEIAIDGDNKSPYTGYMMSDVTLYKSPISYNPVVGLNSAVADAQFLADKATDQKYSGKPLSDLMALINLYKKDATQPYSDTDPAAWAEATRDVLDATSALKNRMDIVDLVIATKNEIQLMLDRVANESYLYMDLIDYNTLVETKVVAENYPFSSKTDDELVDFIQQMNLEMMILENRIVRTKAFDKLFTKATMLVDERERTDFDEYTQLKDVYDSYENENFYLLGDDVLEVLYNLFREKTDAYAMAVQLDKIAKRRISELSALSLKYGSNIGDSSYVRSAIATLRDDDDNLARVYKTAIKASMYERISSVTTEDLTPFIKNYYLYATPIVDNPDVDANIGLGSDIPDYYNKVYSNSNTYHLVHKWSNVDIWGIFLNESINNLYPGWTVSARRNGTNDIVTPDINVTTRDGNGYCTPYEHFLNGESVFDGALSLDWGSTAELKTVLTDLPVGEYTLGFDVRSNYTYANRYNGNTSYIIVRTASGTEYEYAFTSTYFGPETMLIPRESDPSLVDSVVAVNSDNICDTTIFVAIESIEITKGDLMSIDLIVNNGSGYTSIDNFRLIFKPKSGYNYAADVFEARDEVERALADAEAALDPQNPNPYVPVVNTFYMDNVECDAGDNLIIPIKMQNKYPIVGFSLDVELPYGISYVGAELAGGRSSDHTLSTNVTGSWNKQTVSMACLSLSNDALSGNDGTVINLIVNVSDNAESGDYSVWFKNMEMTVNANCYYRPTAIDGVIKVLQQYTPGDVNNDGTISITDAVGIVNFILGIQNSGLNRRAADANQDGIIDVVDAVFVVNKVINRSYAPTRGFVETDITSTLALDNVAASGVMSLPVRIKGMQDEITALQFNLTIPEDVDLFGLSTDGNHLAVSARNDDGSYTVVCLSLSNSTFSGGGDVGLTLKLVSGSSFTGGIVTVDNIKMVTPDCRQKEQDAVVGVLGEGGETGISRINAEDGSTMYDMQGRATDKTNGIYIRDGKKQIQMKK